MKLNFDELELKVMKNFNGGEKELQALMYIDETNKIFRGKLFCAQRLFFRLYVKPYDAYYRT